MGTTLFGLEWFPTLPQFPHLQAKVLGLPVPQGSRGFCRRWGSVGWQNQLTENAAVSEADTVDRPALLLPYTQHWSLEPSLPCLPQSGCLSIIILVLPVCLSSCVCPHLCVPSIPILDHTLPCHSARETLTSAAPFLAHLPLPPWFHQVFPGSNEPVASQDMGQSGPRPGFQEWFGMNPFLPYHCSHAVLPSGLGTRFLDLPFVTDKLNCCFPHDTWLESLDLSLHICKKRPTLVREQRGPEIARFKASSLRLEALTPEPHRSPQPHSHPQHPALSQSRHPAPSIAGHGTVP